MKILATLITIFLSSSAFANVHYWCTPVEYDKGLEAVVIKEVSGQMTIAVYTKSSRWGSVDEYLSQADIKNDQAGDLVYSTASQGVELTIHTNGHIPDQRGEEFTGNIIDQRFNINMNVYCEYLR